jgi:hypothetical protein
MRVEEDERPPVLRNRTGPSGRMLLLGGLVALAAGIVIVVARIMNPTPGVVMAAAVCVVAGFGLTISGALALISRPVWIEGTVVDTRWSVGGLRRVGVVVLDIGEQDQLPVQLDYPIFREIAVGDRLRLEHNSLNRAQVYQVEIIEHGQAGTGPA